jgi:hypothetical protein
LLTFGGDRETFNPFDPVNYLRVDNDVWEYRLAEAWFSAGQAATRLRAASPNPFNPRTTIGFVLDSAQVVNLGVYDLAGRLVTTLAAGSYPPGRHDFVWNGTDEQGRRVASGVYLYRLESPDQVDVKRMVLVK